MNEFETRLAELSIYLTSLYQGVYVDATKFNNSPEFGADNPKYEVLNFIDSCVTGSFVPHAVVITNILATPVSEESYQLNINTTKKEEEKKMKVVQVSPEQLSHLFGEASAGAASSKLNELDELHAAIELIRKIELHQKELNTPAAANPVVSQPPINSVLSKYVAKIEARFLKEL